MPNNNPTAQRAWRVMCSLYQQGVRDYILTTGSRNAPFILAADQLRQADQSVRLHSHFDERGAGFWALGLSKSSHRAVAVITTSGSALVNLHPAAVEARQQRLPVIFISADRPDELLDCGANQAIEQPGSLQPHVLAELNWRVDLPDEHESLFGQQLSDLIAFSLSANGGPVHVNCQFREPLYEPLAKQHYRLPEALGEQAKPKVSTVIPDGLCVNRNTIIVAGQLKPSQAKAVLQLAEKYHLPVLADIGSQLRLQAHQLVIGPLDGVVLNPQGQACLSQVENIIQFGGRLVSKRFQQWLDQFERDYWLVSAQPDALDPGRHAMQRQAPIEQLCEQLMQGELSVDAEPVLRTWQAMQQAINEALPSPKKQFDALNIVASITEQLDNKMALFAGNSLSIRMLDQAVYAKKNSPPVVYTNRGASGIDGLLATAVGCSDYHDALCLLIGDLSFLYDLNSLALCQKVTKPVVVVLLNDNGGGIFNLLPITRMPALHREFFQAPHDLQFGKIAQQFGLQYASPTDLSEFSHAFHNATGHQGVTLIECQMDAQQSIAALSALANRFAT